MNNQSYVAGFCDAAVACGMDPRAVARSLMVKSAQATTPATPAASAAGATPAAPAAAQGSWTDSLKNLTGDVARWWEDNPELRPLVGAGLGAAVGTGLGAAISGKKGLRPGAILGAVGGAGASVDWRGLAEALGRMSQGSRERAAAEKAKADAAAAAAQNTPGTKS